MMNRLSALIAAVAGMGLATQGGAAPPASSSPPPASSLYARVTQRNIAIMDQAQAVVIYGANQRKGVPIIAGESRKIFVQPGETVAIAVTLPVAQAGDVVDITPVDGGTVDTLPSGLVVADGRLALFRFRVPQGPGLYRVWLNEGANQYVFQFRVLDPAGPSPGPNTIVAY